ncbi:hypothetical protein KIL84_016871 [Mauremys mutica]|uniref:Uncharacterized protein n=1 Tax=Mauremys mutica TaxID=74926 RepID=A0A9D3X3S1_9SAUR|nr:hypothetical protein KIL84_016871 [Mauremys mutica]
MVESSPRTHINPGSRCNLQQQGISWKGAAPQQDNLYWTSGLRAVEIPPPAQSISPGLTAWDPRSKSRISPLCSSAWSPPPTAQSPLTLQEGLHRVDEEAKHCPHLLKLGATHLLAQHQTPAKSRGPTAAQWQHQAREPGTEAAAPRRACWIHSWQLDLREEVVAGLGSHSSPSPSSTLQSQANSALQPHPEIFRSCASPTSKITPDLTPQVKSAYSASIKKNPVLHTINYPLIPLHSPQCSPPPPSCGCVWAFSSICIFFCSNCFDVKKGES